MTPVTTTFKALDDRALLDLTRQLAVDERRATAALLRALVEVDTRRLYLREGCASMFAWCTQVLHLSEGGAYNRIEVARAARTYPVILELVEQAAVTLTTVRLLAPHLTLENHIAVLETARHGSKRDIERLVATLQPKPDAPTIVRRVPDRSTPSVASLSPAPAAPPDWRRPSACAAAPRPSPEPGVSSGDRAGATALTDGNDDAPAPVRVAPTRVAPLAPARYRIQVTVSGETHDKLRRAQALLRHAVPTGDAAEILDRALTVLVDHLERRRFAETTRPRTSKPCAAGSRHIPAAVRREVWRRDGGRCAFVGSQGRCAETAFLEFHHVEPYAAGGAATIGNIELRCRAHNAHEARLHFGPGLLLDHHGPTRYREGQRAEPLSDQPGRQPGGRC